MSKCSQPLTKEELDNALLTQEQIENEGKSIKPLKPKKTQRHFDWAEPNDDYIDIVAHGGNRKQNNDDDENQYQGIRVFTF